MKIALIIPAHNGLDDLKCCMAAISASSRQADELILVDDGSKPVSYTHLTLPTIYSV